MSNNDEHMELMNARLRVIESHLVENYKVLEDIRDVLLILAGSSPVPTREDASRERHPSGDTRVRRGTLSRQDGPVLRVAEGSEQERPSERVMRMVNCDHDWPAELTPDSECPLCGMTYKHWSAATNR